MKNISSIKKSIHQWENVDLGKTPMAPVRNFRPGASDHWTDSFIRHWNERNNEAGAENENLFLFGIRDDHCPDTFELWKFFLIFTFILVKNSIMSPKKNVFKMLPFHYW